MKPDKNCVTLPDGSCVGKDCMHDLPLYAPRKYITLFVVFLAFGIFMLGYSFGLDRAVRIAQEVMDTPSEAVEIHDPNPNSKYRVLNERHSIWDQDPLTPSPRQRCVIEGNEVICD